MRKNIFENLGKWTKLNFFNMLSFIHLHIQILSELEITRKNPMKPMFL